MIISIDTEVASKLGLTPVEYLHLYLLYNGQGELQCNDTHSIYQLESKGFIKDTEDAIVLRKKSIDLFSRQIPEIFESLESFVESYRNLFPSGVKSGGRLVKGDRLGCLSKLKSFKVKYPEYTQEEIIDATKAYIDLKKKNGWQMMSCADYFIEKDKQSQLASYCEDIKTRGAQASSNSNNGVGKTKGI